MSNFKMKATKWLKLNKFQVFDIISNELHVSEDSLAVKVNQFKGNINLPLMY